MLPLRDPSPDQTDTTRCGELDWTCQCLEKLRWLLCGLWSEDTLRAFQNTFLLKKRYYRYSLAVIYLYCVECHLLPVEHVGEKPIHSPSRLMPLMAAADSLAIVHLWMFVKFPYHMVTFRLFTDKLVNHQVFIGLWTSTQYIWSLHSDSNK